MIFTPDQLAMEVHLHRQAESNDFARRKFLYLPEPFARPDEATADLLEEAHASAQQQRFEP